MIGKLWQVSTLQVYQPCLGDRMGWVSVKPKPRRAQMNWTHHVLVFSMTFFELLILTLWMVLADLFGLYWMSTFGWYPVHTNVDLFGLSWLIDRWGWWQCLQYMFFCTSNHYQSRLFLQSVISTNCSDIQRTMSLLLPVDELLYIRSNTTIPIIVNQDKTC